MAEQVGLGQNTLKVLKGCSLNGLGSFKVYHVFFSLPLVSQWRKNENFGGRDCKLLPNIHSSIYP